MPIRAAMRRGRGSTSFEGGCRVVYCGAILAALSACAMPSLENGSHLLTMPPGSNERATVTSAPEPPMVQQTSRNAETEVLLGAESQSSPQPTDGSTSQGEKILEPLPPDGFMRGEFSGSAVAFADRDGLICAGRLISRNAILSNGVPIPVNCSDGTAGRVKFVSWASADEAECLLYLGDSPGSPVRLVRSASLE